MNKDELIHGKFYHLSDPNPDDDVEIVFQFDSLTKSDDIIKSMYDVSADTFEGFTKGDTFSIEGRTIREATREEHRWLLSCIKADKYIKKPLTIDDLENGKFYHINIGTEREIVFQFNRNTGDKDRPLNYYYVSTMDGNNLKADKACFITERECRVATDDERQWLITCIKNNKFIHKDEVKNYSVIEINYEGISAKKDNSYDIPKERVIEKSTHELEYSDFYHGQRFTGTIEGLETYGVVTIEDDRIFLCQDVYAGTKCTETHGFAYSYVLSSAIVRNKVSIGTPGINVAFLKLEIPDRKTIIDIYKNHVSDSIVGITPLSAKVFDHINVIGLEDPADDRLMSSYTDDLSFIGFSRINGGAVFKLKERDQTEFHWQTMIQDIGTIGGMVQTIHDVNDHIIDEGFKKNFQLKDTNTDIFAAL